MTSAKRAKQHRLTVKARGAIGKRSVRRLRQEGFIPGTVYGRLLDAPVSIAVSHKALVSVLHSKAGEHALVTLRIESDGTASGNTESKRTKPSLIEKSALVKSVQHDPVHGYVLHVDFQTIALSEKIKVKIPLILRGESVGVKEDSGVLEQFLREIEVECLPAEIPSDLQLDVSALKIGDAVHVASLSPPPHTRILADTEAVIASVQAPRVEKAEEELEAPAEPEVISEKKQEGEGEKAEAGKEQKPEKEEGKPEKEREK